MNTPNINSITIDLWRRAAADDYTVAVALRPLHGAATFRVTHILAPKLAELVALLTIDVPAPPPRPVTLIQQ